jgi:Rhodopirellula transposase DDE domain
MGAYACAMVTAADREAEVTRKWELLSPFLDERQRRLWLAAEAREGGRGGVSLVAHATGAARSTVTRGVFELENGQEEPGRARRPGGGRKGADVTDPGIVAALRALVDPDARGDPGSPLLWTTKSLRTLAGELGRAGHAVSPMTVGRLLKDAGFSLQSSVKTLEGSQHPDRDGQFRYLNARAEAHRAAGEPVISVDAKKKEKIGQYKQAGRSWRPKGRPGKTNVHDFIDKELGKVTPYGVYDVAANSGWVAVGTDHDTAQFAVSTIRAWWHNVGREAYHGASRLLVTADGGGSNGCRTRLWKTELARFAAETGLEVTVCHLPPGTSKWNKIEHRLFSQISLAWKDRPLVSHEVVVSTIAAVTTRTGLTVTAGLDTGEYPKGVKITAKQIKDLEETGILHRHDFHGEWNYTVKPGTELRVLFLDAH